MGKSSRAARVGSLQSAVRRMNSHDVPETSGGAASRLDRQRRLLADLCRMLDPQASGGSRPGPTREAGGNGFPLPEGARLTPRMTQTLERLLAGDSEKQIAGRLGRSPHTIHVYVKELYKRFRVSSRGELFARFVRNGPDAR